MLTTEQIAGIVRAVLAAAGGGAVLTADLLTQVAGAVAVLVSVAWSVLSKKKKTP